MSVEENNNNGQSKASNATRVVKVKQAMSKHMLQIATSTWLQLSAAQALLVQEEIQQLYFHFLCLVVKEE